MRGDPNRHGSEPEAHKRQPKRCAQGRLEPSPAPGARNLHRTKAWRAGWKPVRHNAPACTSDHGAVCCGHGCGYALCCRARIPKVSVKGVRRPAPPSANQRGVLVCCPVRRSSSEPQRMAANEAVVDAFGLRRLCQSALKGASPFAQTNSCSLASVPDRWGACFS